LLLSQPRLPAPDLNTAVDAGNDGISVQAGMLSEKGGNHDPPLSVELAWHCTAEKSTSKDANLRTYLRKVIDGSRQGLPRHGWIDTQAGVEAPGQYSAVPEASPHFRRNRHSALVVQIPLILAEKHSAAFRH